MYLYHKSVATKARTTKHNNSNSNLEGNSKTLSDTMRAIQKVLINVLTLHIHMYVCVYMQALHAWASS